MVTLRSSKKLVISATIVGNILEWYEFGLYAYLAPTISKLFFPPTDTELAATINILLIFAVGFISRPIGGLFFGHIGDRYGRRIAILSSITTITLPTFLIGVLPTYEKIGYWAPVLLGLMRILQGFPVGGEFPGTICYLEESASSKERGYFGSFAFFASQIGIFLTIIESYLMEHYLSLKDLLQWGWRISFLVGGLIGLIGFSLRYRLKETPLFQTLEKQEKVAKAPIHKVLKEFKMKMFYTFLIAALPLGSFYLIFVFIGVYMERYFGNARPKSLMINAVFMLLSTIFLPFIGKLSDRYGCKRMLQVSAGLTALIAFPFFYEVVHGNLWGMYILQFILVALISIHFALLPQELAGFFPTSVRFTGLAFSYNICNIIIAGSFPFLALFLINKTGNPYIPAVFLASIALMTFFALLPSRESGGELDVIE